MNEQMNKCSNSKQWNECRPGKTLWVGIPLRPDRMGIMELNTYSLPDHSNKPRSSNKPEGVHGASGAT